MNKQKYFETGCPTCKEQDGSIQVDETKEEGLLGVTLKMHCENCGCKWTETMRIVEKNVVEVGKVITSREIAELIYSLIDTEEGGYDGENELLPISFSDDDVNTVECVEAVVTAWVAESGLLFQVDEGDFDKDEEALHTALVRISDGSVWLVQWNHNMAVQQCNCIVFV